MFLQIGNEYTIDEMLKARPPAAPAVSSTASPEVDRDHEVEEANDLWVVLGCDGAAEEWCDIL